jgi:hypothetical protein
MLLLAALALISRFDLGKLGLGGQPGLCELRIGPQQPNTNGYWFEPGSSLPSQSQRR